METTKQSRSDDPKQARSTTVVLSELLFKGAREMTIEHDGSLYSLRITKNNKLILTK